MSKIKRITVETEDGVEHVLPHRWMICPACEGEGKSSAYLGAITSEDRQPGGAWEDPEEFEAYMNGAYDRPCERCSGSGKIMMVDERRCDPSLLKLWREVQQAEREDRAAQAAERRMGA